MNKMTIHSLDDQALACVLGLLDQQQLLLCESVCSTWRAAVPKAISKLVVKNLSQEKADALQQWVSSRAPELQALVLDSAAYISQLQAEREAAARSMCDPRGALQGDEESKKPAIKPTTCRLPLKALAQLTALDVGGCNLQPSSCAEDDQHAGGVLDLPAVLPQLLRLRNLRLCQLPAPFSEPVFGLMPSLQRLERVQDACSPTLMDTLPPSLTYLSLPRYVKEAFFVRSPSSPQLDNLRALTVEYCGSFRTAVLARMPQLTSQVGDVTQITAEGQSFNLLAVCWC
jgi:hypothetical protein